MAQAPAMIDSSQGWSGASTVSSVTPRAASTGSTHTVRSGETLYRIGLKYHVAVDQLRKWNNLENNTVAVGQKLIVSRP